MAERTRSLSDANDQLGKAYDDLKQAQQTLVESEKMASLGSLVAGVAHEINTPIDISVTASSYLQERVADFKLHIEAKQLSRTYLNEFTQNLDESMQLLQGNLRRASELIASFKQVAVDQSSEARYNFSLADNLHQVVVSLGYKLKKAQCEVDIQCDPKLSIYSFPGSFTQIYSNLILNSIHHGFDGWDRPRKITIQVAQQGDELVIDYSDNGRGIPLRYCRASSIPSSPPSGARVAAGSALTSSTTWWSSCCAAASTAPANRARVPSSTFVCPSSRTEHRLLWAGRFVPIML